MLKLICDICEEQATYSTGSDVHREIDTAFGDLFSFTTSGMCKRCKKAFDAAKKDFDEDDTIKRMIKAEKGYL